MISDTLSHKHLFSIAPMMGYTDRHFHYIASLLTGKAVLYTEMKTASAILHAPRIVDENHIDQQVVALQIAGCSPQQLAQCAGIAGDRGYHEVNLNLGCPSLAAQKGGFGAAMMQDTELTARSIASIKRHTSLPVSVKCRLGAGELTGYPSLRSFVERVSAAGCKTFIVHARLALLNGVSTHANRTVPPLDYDQVRQLKRDFKSLEIILNGGIQHIEKYVSFVQEEQAFDGIMVGREIFRNPWILSSVDSLYFKEQPSSIRVHSFIEKICHYLENEVSRGVDVRRITRHLAYFTHTMPYAKKWRQWLNFTVKDLTMSQIQRILTQNFTQEVSISQQVNAYTEDKHAV